MPAPSPGARQGRGRRRSSCGPPLRAPARSRARGPAEGARTRSGNAFELEEGTNPFRYASGLDAWNLWVDHYGPTKALADSLDDGRREELKRAMVAWHETFPSSLGYEQPRDYLVTVGVRPPA